MDSNQIDLDKLVDFAAWHRQNQTPLIEEVALEVEIESVPEPEPATQPSIEAQGLRPIRAHHQLIGALIVSLVLATGISEAVNRTQEAKQSVAKQPSITSLSQPPPAVIEHEPELARPQAGQRPRLSLSEPDLLEVRQRDAFGGHHIEPTAIVLHWTAEIYDNVHHFVKSIDASGASVQFFIDRHGHTWQLSSPLAARTAHAEGVNEQTVGIEIEGRGEGDLLHNQSQLEAVIATVEWLTARFNIPLESQPWQLAGVLGHDQIDGSRHDKDYDGKIDVGPRYRHRIIRGAKEYRQETEDLTAGEQSTTTTEEPLVIESPSPSAA